MFQLVPFWGRLRCQRQSGSCRQIICCLASSQRHSARWQSTNTNRTSNGCWRELKTAWVKKRKRNENLCFGRGRVGRVAGQSPARKRQCRDAVGQKRRAADRIAE